MTHDLSRKVPVEALDDDRVAHLERRVVAHAGDRLARPVPARRPWLAIAGALAVAAVAFALGWRLRPGDELVAHDEPGALAPATLAVRAEPGATTVDLGDATITASAHAAYAVARPDGGVRIDLARGKVALAVAKRGTRPPLVVRAGDTDVVVVGTRFSVDYHDGTGDPDVVVTEGIVRVVKRAAHVDVRVAADHAWHATTGVIAETIALADPRDAIEVDPPAPAPAPTPTAPPAMRDHVAVVPDAHVTTTEHAPARGSADVALAGGPEVSRRPPGFGSATPAPEARKLEAQIRATALPAPARVDTSDPASAVAAYYAMLRAKQSPEDESRALYGIAYTQAMRLGRGADALATIAQYARRFGGQPGRYAERDAVLWLEVRLACLAPALRVDCRQAASDYLRDASDAAPGRAVAAKIVE